MLRAYVILEHRCPIAVFCQLLNNELVLGKESRERSHWLTLIIGHLRNFFYEAVDYKRSTRAVCRVLCVCVCLCACFLVVLGVGCWNKAALWLVNLSHKYQLAGRYAITTEMYTCSTWCIWPHCLIHSHTHTHIHKCDTHKPPSLYCHPPRGHFTLTPLVHHSQKHPPPDWVWWRGVWGQDGV